MQSNLKIMLSDWDLKLDLCKVVLNDRKPNKEVGQADSVAANPHRAAEWEVDIEAAVEGEEEGRVVHLPDL